MEFKREELQKLRVRAERAAGDYVLCTSWKRAYYALGDAANTLDALIARRDQELKEMNPSPKE